MASSPSRTTCNGLSTFAFAKARRTRRTSSSRSSANKIRAWSGIKSSEFVVKRGRRIWVKYPITARKPVSEGRKFHYHSNANGIGSLAIMKIALFGIPAIKLGKHNLKDPRFDQTDKLVAADKN